ncbi:alanine racemase [uncultured Alistipes sp.]|uniref:alanine racemase n=1 Tax=uncultured Alistipes sp. TaxID=538949 RepID=UPI0026067699|nr:alanine racemase [uncultured Alistipes sp.]
MRYSLSEIAQICEGRLSGEDLTVGRISTDSRNCNVGDGELFVAMRGVNHDSHAFVGEMARRGVRAFLVEHPVELPDGCGCVVVERSIDALQRLAAHHRAQFKGRVVGITGSNGKTVVKEWISQQIPPMVKYFRSPKSYNSQLGVALSLLMIEGDEQLALIEAGISQPGEMVRLERMIRPDVVIFTSIGEAHQKNFASLEEKSAEKLVLAKGAKTILYHRSSALLERMIRTLFSNRELLDAADYRLPEQLPEGVLASEAGRIDAQIVGAFCRAMGFPAPDFDRIQPVAMRLEVKEGINRSLLIDDAYNSDINSLSIALDYLHNMAAGRPTTLILSDIEQSGVADETLYAEVARIVSAAGVGRLIGVGEHIRAAGALFACDSTFYHSTDELLHHLRTDDVAGRVVLIKGSRNSRFERVSHMLERKSHTTILEVDLDAMIHNLNCYRSKLRPGTRLVAMVKASSYGAGDFEIAQMLQHQGVNYLAVAFADEGVLLRERGISMPIVVLNADEGSFDLMVSHRLEPEIYSFRSLDNFSRAVERAGEEHYPIHIKLDTGMHRLGFSEEELDCLAERLCATQRVKVASTFSHLSCADMPEKDEFTHAQIARFDRMSSHLASLLPYSILRHTANSAAIERFPEAQFDMCRLGIGLYGFGGTPEDDLHPVSTLKTRIVQLHHLAAGEAVGYGGAGVLKRPSLIATIPVGYADGLDRHLSCGRWSMRVAGKAAPIVGRICMDSCMIDVTDIPEVAEGDEVVIFSAEPGNTAEDMARVLGTISYEVMTSVSGRVKRIYKKE